jgi:hypothetical protein
MLPWTAIIVALAIAIFPISSSARKLASVEGPIDNPKVEVIADEPLVLNGSATHSIFVFKIYTASLYLKEASSNSEDILNSPNLKIGRMKFLRKLEAAEVRESFLEMFRENCQDSCDQLQPALAQFLGVIPNLEIGSEITFRISSESFKVQINDSPFVEISPPGLGTVILRSWIGDNPPSRRFRKRLLGIES